jgi:gluconolactonase
VTGQAGTGAGAGGTATAGTGAGGGGTTGSAGTSGLAGSGSAGTGGSAVAGTGGPGTAGRGGTTGAAGTSAAGTSGGGAGAGGRGGTGGGAGGGSGGASARWTCPAGPFTNPSSAQLALTRVTGVPPFDSFNNEGNNYGNIEGAVWLGDALYVSEIASGNNPPPSRILRIDAAFNVTVAIADAGSNGLAFDNTGRLLSANHKFGGLTAFSLPGGQPTQVVATYNGMRFNSPNDLTVKSDGTIFFTDPDYQAPSQRPQAMTRIYKVAPGASTATVVDDTRRQPNGITLSLDETQLYVGTAEGIFRYAIDASGTVGAGTRFANSISSSDGMTIDCAGNLYVTANSNSQVVVLSPTGTTIAMVSQMGVTNVAFGGTDHRTLFVTAMGNGKQGSNPGPQGLFRATLPLPGMPY